jgi:hypothetical protein
MANVKVVQDPEKTVTVEVLAEAIASIADGLRKLRAGRLNDRALILLIQHAAPTLKSYPPKYISAKQVQAVLDGIDSLEREYLKPKKAVS